MLGLSVNIGIDLGTANTRVCTKGKGIVISEPSVVAVDGETRKVLAVGGEARRMIGRTPGSILAIRPMKDGVIADYEITEVMLRYFINRACGRKVLIRPRVIVCVPSKVTGVHKRAVLEAALQAGARQTFLMEEPMAAAIGAGLNIWEPAGHMVVDIGGGTTDIAVISLGGIVVADSCAVGGDKFDESIIRYVRQEHNLMIGERTAEDIKIRIGSVCPGSPGDTAEIRGRDFVTGLPKIIDLSSEEACQALSEPVTEIIDSVKGVLERTPPELAADIVDRGIICTGGGALLDGFARRMSEEIGIPVHIAEDPMNCVIMGTGKVFGAPEVLKNSLVAGAKSV
jgi:rod shape-determining protein MreB